MSNWHGISDYQRQQRWTPFQNTLGESTVPEFGVMVSSELDISTGQPLLGISQPAGGDNEAYFINSPLGVAVGQRGSCTRDFPCIARYKGSAPAVGEEWGPKSGQWTLDSEESGFTIVAAGTAPDSSGEGLVLVIAAGGGPACDFIRFKIVDADCDNRVAIGQVLARPCGCSTVKGEDDGEVNLIDKAGCFLDEGNDRMIGRQGFAKRLESNEESGSIGSVSLILKSADIGENVGECGWEIFSMCCTRECD